jgi:hypothetical protein
MIASLVILSVSTVLFLYWFRYTCELILSARTAASYAAGVSAVNGLSWSSVSAELHAAPASAFADMMDSLRQDYRKLDDVLSRSKSDDADQVAFERGMLRGYFCWSVAMFTLLRVCSDRSARQMLATMSRVIEHQANLIGERARPAEISLS